MSSTEVEVPTTTKPPSCLLCSSQENYCFNSPADVFALIELKRRKKGVSRFLSNLIFLERVKLKPDSAIFICEVHYAKDDLDRICRENGKYEVKPTSDAVLPCYVKLEERALNNRIKSFLFLVDEHEKCLNMGLKWTSKTIKRRFSLTLDTKDVEIRIADNLEMELIVKNAVMDLKFAIDVGFVEANRRIMFWSRLRGMMKYFEEKYSPEWKVVVVGPPKVGRPRKIKPVEIVPKIVKKVVKEPQAVVIKTIKEESDASDGDDGPPAFKISKVALPEKTKDVSEDLLSFTKMYKIDTNSNKEVKMNLSEYSNEGSVNSLMELIPIITHHSLPNWHMVVGHYTLCILRIIIDPKDDRPVILKALKIDHKFHCTGFLLGKEVINNQFAASPTKISPEGIFSLLKLLDEIPAIDFPETTSSQNPKFVGELSNDDPIPSFAALLNNLQAFSGNGWLPLCVCGKVVLIFKIDVSDVPQFKRYVSFNRNLEMIIYNNGQLVIPKKDAQLTKGMIHRTLSSLDETVFEKILRPSKYRDNLEENVVRVMEEDPRVTIGTSKKHKCTICPYESNTLNYVKQHYEIKHTPPDRECPECGKKMNATQLKIHARFHIKKVKCNVCNKGFADSRDLKKHVNVHNKLYRQPRPLKPLQNNQLMTHSDENGTIFKHEPLIKIDEIEGVTFSMNVDEIQGDYSDGVLIMDET